MTYSFQQISRVCGPALLFALGLLGSQLLPSRPLAASASAPTVRMNQPAAPVTLVAYTDRWNLAKERWWDIGSFARGGRDYYNQYNDWITAGVPNGKFDYKTRAAGVKLTYDKSPAGPHFVGHISVRGLKPNFAYQLKLCGKPIQGSRGMGTAMSYVSASSKLPSGTPVMHTKYDAAGRALPINGNDWANQQIGYAGRWWNDSNPSSNTNSIIDEDYQINSTDTICGYIFMGDFITDKNGDAEWDIVGNKSYHITWQSWQASRDEKEVRMGTYYISTQMDGANPRHYYGYGATPPASRVPQHNGINKVTLFYEYEWNRPHIVKLRPGTYHCRLLITEETFHNGFTMGTNTSLGGKWKTVMATEDFVNGAPDTDAANDIVFTIR